MRIEAPISVDAARGVLLPDDEPGADPGPGPGALAQGGRGRHRGHLLRQHRGHRGRGRGGHRRPQGQHRGGAVRGRGNILSGDRSLLVIYPSSQTKTK